MNPAHAYFTSQLATARIKSEHCIGLLKTRFQYLNGIRSQLARRRHLRRIIRYVSCTCILHNLLIAELAREEWEDGMQQYGASSNDLDAFDELNMAIATDAGGKDRRNQLLAYLLEVRG